MRISDWSSDVCSSDLPAQGTPVPGCKRQRAGNAAGVQVLHQAEEEGQLLLPDTLLVEGEDEAVAGRSKNVVAVLHPLGDALEIEHQIGRASCRERVCQYV